MMENKVEALKQLHTEMMEAERVLQMKRGQYGDLLQDIFTKELGFDKDSKEAPLHQVLSAVMRVSKQ